jgi:hypothetical protein
MINETILSSDRLWDSVAGQGAVVFLPINTTASLDLVTAVPGRRVRVLGLSLSAAGATTVTFQSGGSTNLTGAITLSTGTPLVWPTTAQGYLQTNAGEKLNLVLSAGVQVSGSLVYALF